jgi:hypothetical protein
MVERYAQALKHARGLECRLPEFAIDRMGWSPQLAATLGDDYLGAEALRYAIILSPDQANASLLRRRYSYEAPLIEMVYLQAHDTILSLIEHEPVVIELDNGQTFCRAPIDVINIQSALARIETPRETLAKSRRLLELAHGLSEQARLLDEHYIDQMLALAKDVGDPRRRTLPPGLRLTIGSLWALIDGAVYVLRRPNGRSSDTIVVSTRVDTALQGLPCQVIAIDEPQLIDLLVEAGFLRYGNEAALLRKRLGDLELDTLLSIDGPAPAADAAARRRQFASNPAAQAALPPV